MIIRKSPSEIERMAKSGELVARTLAIVGAAIAPGVTTAELDALAEEFIRRHVSSFRAEIPSSGCNARARCSAECGRALECFVSKGVLR